ncbi:MAG: phosphoglucomutase (alpha-D-glucose-1,6-bisphosphate-dependent) [Rhizomicrobium sp.]
METKISPLAGKPAPEALLVDVPGLLAAYEALTPDPHDPRQRVAFGTSGHRGSSLRRSFNAWHIWAITQAICDYRKSHGITGPLFLGEDTHALSAPARQSAVEVLAANEVMVRLSETDAFTPTPALSHAILVHNRTQPDALADGIVITPSHNPPDDGGFKYNPPNGGPADTEVTRWIEARANVHLASGLREVRRISYAQALRTASVGRHDFQGAYIADLANILDMDAIKGCGLKLAVDPLGGAGVHYWGRIAEDYGLALEVLNQGVDPTFAFMSVDWDGQIRMDPSSPYAMQGVIALKEKFDIIFACDTDHDRHGIVTRSRGLMAANHYLCAMIAYLFDHRPHWSQAAGIGKTVVSSGMIDRLATRLGHALYEVPVGFKWFVDGLLAGRLGFVGEESAGASFCRKDGTVWTTDKDGIVPALLSAEIAARTGRDPGELYGALENEFGAPVYARIDAPASAEQKPRLAKLGAGDISSKQLAGEPIREILTEAPGNHAAIGGLKVSTENGWFAARPSGTEDIYKIYAESFLGKEHLKQIQDEAQAMISRALSGG